MLAFYDPNLAIGVKQCGEGFGEIIVVAPVAPPSSISKSVIDAGPKMKSGMS